ncbi:MAG: HAMP domain-containing histidine kinase [Pedobacter sp.]|nr:MAG: HAMP domain-containing histidine kinase [Pedobacter sp.]
MQKKIVFVLVLMSCCVLGITGLQLYWNYKNYQTVVANFKKDANNALDVAVDKEMLYRKEQLVLKIKKWMNDTTILKITCDTTNKDHETAFTMEDVTPYYPDEKADKITMGISSFKDKVGKITPEAKAVFINHFAEIVRSDLKESTVHYYTQGLGHKIENVFKESRLDETNFSKIYKQELAKRSISTSFKLNADSAKYKKLFVTHKVNTAFRRPYENTMVWAGLENPNQYYLREMKWLIIGSFLLIGITIYCFYYTVRTLLNQTKLVAIKNQFISNMTHEINTPLASIQVTTEALQQFDPETATRKKYLDIILYQTKKLNDLSNEILENAKLETIDFAMDEKIDLAKLIKNSVVELDNRNLIELNFDETEFIVTGNRTHLTRSISNILENAIKYNTADSPTIKVKLAKSNGNVWLNIEDNGPGIADEFKTKIFEQFYRIPTGNMHNIKGYGLGLSYVKKVIAQHKGSVSVLDNQPYGTIFSINLPS